MKYRHFSVMHQHLSMIHQIGKVIPFIQYSNDYMSAFFLPNLTVDQTFD
ncbi:hypothetical protein [Oceanobacillus massiliensis]|nr:hypothetical protein [Oceanobacillus massiliensis]